MKRTVLFVVLAVLALTCHLSAQTDQLTQARELRIDWDHVNAEATQLLAEYVRIDTSNPPGNESQGVKWLEQIFRAEGIPFETGESAPGRGSIAARLKGTGMEPALVLLSHIDVVPVNREFWTADPFAAEMRDGYLWGRGAVDTKSLTIAGLEAMLLLHRNRVPLRRDVILLATADEEAGGIYGAGWVVKNHPEWIAGAGFLLNEAARAVADDSGKPLYFRTGPTEKTPAWLRLTAKGRAGHGAVPNPDTVRHAWIRARVLLSLQIHGFSPKTGLLLRRRTPEPAVRANFSFWSPTRACLMGGYRIQNLLSWLG